MTDETRTPSPWPFNGYAPGHYTVGCPDCGEIKHGLDKRAIRCLECAVIAARTPSPDVPGSVAGAVPSPALSSERSYYAGGDHASGSRSRHGEGTPIEPQPDDYSGARVFDPGDSTRMDARGLARNAELLRKFWSDDRGTSLHLHCADLLDQAAAMHDRIKRDADTIARLNAEVENAFLSGFCAAKGVGHVTELSEAAYHAAHMAFQDYDAALAPKEG